MANWTLRLRVGTDRLAFDQGEIDLKELCKRYHDKLTAKVGYIRDVMGEHDLSEDAEDIAHDFTTVDNVEEFDEALERLYDWADTTLSDEWPRKKLCWVEPTSSSSKKAPSVPSP